MGISSESVKARARRTTATRVAPEQPHGVKPRYSGLAGCGRRIVRVVLAWSARESHVDARRRARWRDTVSPSLAAAVISSTTS